MSVATGYKQFLRKYRLLIISKEESTVTFVTETVKTDTNVTGSATQTGKVTGGKVNVRKGPSTRYKSYGILRKNTQLTIYGKESGWYIIGYSKGVDGKAYMSGKYVKVTGGGDLNITTDVTTTRREDTVSVVDKTTIDLSNLHCTFYCEKSTTDTPNYSQITVYNPSQATISAVKAGDTVVLEAGYENGNYGMIFTGQIVQPYSVKEGGTDVALTLIVQDGDVFLNSTFTVKTVGKSATQADIVKACMDNGISSGMMAKSLSQTRLARGRVLFGKSSKYIRKIARGNQSQMYVEDGIIHIVAASDYDSKTAVELNPETGLVGMPSQTDDGVSGQCLINPSIKLNTLIYINQRLITAKQVSEGETTYAKVNADGVYRIVKLVYEGDTHGDTWYCTFEAIAQSGMKPAGLKDGATNPWR